MADYDITGSFIHLYALTLGMEVVYNLIDLINYAIYISESLRKSPVQKAFSDQFSSPYLFGPNKVHRRRVQYSQLKCNPIQFNYNPVQ